LPSGAANGGSLRRPAPSHDPPGSVIPAQFPLSRHHAGSLHENPCVLRLRAIEGLSLPRRSCRLRRRCRTAFRPPVDWLVVVTFPKISV